MSEATEKSNRDVVLQAGLTQLYRRHGEIFSCQANDSILIGWLLQNKADALDKGESYEEALTAVGSLLAPTPAPVVAPEPEAYDSRKDYPWLPQFTDIASLRSALGKRFNDFYFDRAGKSEGGQNRFGAEGLSARAKEFRALVDRLIAEENERRRDL